MTKIPNLAITLIFPDKEYVKYLGEVTSTASLENREIDEKGFYSQEIFGPIGSEDRMNTFGYIDLYLNIMHPKIYEYLLRINPLYKGILTSTKYAIYDSKSKDFILSDETNGRTGYSFFMEHLYDINPKYRDVDEVNNMIDSFYRYRKLGILTNNKLLVLPAGMRDISLENDGRVKEDELTEYYKKVLSAAKILEPERDINPLNEYLVVSLQQKIQDLFLKIFTILKGKKGFIGKNVSSRAIDFGTRNIATGKSQIIQDVLDDSEQDYINTAIMGLYQFVKGAEPVVKYCVNHHFIGKIFNTVDSTATLYNPSTKSIENISIENSDLDRWTTSKGLTNLFNRIQDQDVRQSPVAINDYYLSPVYDDGKNITVYFNNDSIPDNIRGKLRGITYGEFIYISIYKKIHELITTITRYPIAEQGGTFPAYIEVATTTEYRTVNVTLENDIEINNKEIKRYPNLNSIYDDSITVSHSRVSGLGLDYDGDILGSIILLSKEAIEEAKRFINSSANYIRPDGKLTVDIGDYITNIVMKTMSKRP